MDAQRNIGLTARASDLLAFLRVYIGEHGISPTYDEMKAALDLQSKSGIHRLLAQLVERGAVRWMPNRARAIYLTDAQAFRLPGNLAARLTAEAARNGKPADAYLAEMVGFCLADDPAPYRVRPPEVRV